MREGDERETREQDERERLCVCGCLPEDEARCRGQQRSDPAPAAERTIWPSRTRRGTRSARAESSQPASPGDAPPQTLNAVSRRAPFRPNFRCRVGMVGGRIRGRGRVQDEAHRHRHRRRRRHRPSPGRPRLPAETWPRAGFVSLGWERTVKRMSGHHEPSHAALVGPRSRLPVAARRAACGPVLRGFCPDTTAGCRQRANVAPDF